MTTLIHQTPIFDAVHAEHPALPIVPVPVETHQDFMLRMGFPSWLQNVERGITKVGGRTKKTAKSKPTLVPKPSAD